MGAYLEESTRSTFAQVSSKQAHRALPARFVLLGRRHMKGLYGVALAIHLDTYISDTFIFEGAPLSAI
jgi:hypothetical protein